MKPKQYVCVHCGEELTNGMHLNPWLPWPTYECPFVQGGVPACNQGQEWYGRNTWVTVAGRDLRPEAAELPREERV